MSLQQLPLIGRIDRYNFTEGGYVTSASCKFNESSAWALSGPVDDSCDQVGVPNFCWANGRRPNDDWTPPPDITWYALPCFGPSPAAIVAWSAGSCCGLTNGTSPYIVSIAAGDYYMFLNNLQCELFFAPAAMDVSVSVSDRTIRVVPQGENTGIEDPEPRGQLRQWALRDLFTLPMIESNLYVSTIGEALRTNIVNKLDSPSLNVSQPYNAAILPAVEDALEAAMDEILLSLGGAALTQPGSYDTLNTSFHISVIHIGSRKYILALFAINVPAMMLICLLSIYTRLFMASPAFDFADLGGMVAGVSNASAGTGEDVLSPNLKGWNVDPADPLLRRSVLAIDSRLGSTEAICVTVRRIGTQVITQKTVR